MYIQGPGPGLPGAPRRWGDWFLVPLALGACRGLERREGQSPPEGGGARRLAAKARAQRLEVEIALERVIGKSLPPQDVFIDLLKAQVAAARKVYELNIMAYKAGFAKGYDLENLCLWSVRWLDAERDLSKKPADRIAAAAAHLARVKTVGTMANAIAKVEPAVGRQAAAAEFYRVQAQIWLTQAKGK